MSCETYVIGLPNGRIIVGNREVQNCPIRMNNRQWLSDLIVVDLPTDDVIMGIDWMDHHDAILSIRKRMVTVTSDNGFECTFQGDKSQSLREGYQCNESS